MGHRITSRQHNANFFGSRRAARYSYSMYRLNEEITPGPRVHKFSHYESCAISRLSETVTGDYSLASVRVCSRSFASINITRPSE